MSSEAIATPPTLAPCAGMRALPSLRRWILRGDPAVLAAAGANLGFALPSPGRAAAAPDRAALWLGPDEQLLLDLRATQATMTSWLPPLRAALAPLAHSLVEISQRQTAFTVSGPAAAALSAGCPLDLDIGSFAVGGCTRTVFGKAEIVLWRTAADTFHVEVWRSFATYVTQLLAQAASEV